jgi:hypothetical protein
MEVMKNVPLNLIRVLFVRLLRAALMICAVGAVAASAPWVPVEPERQFSVMEVLGLPGTISSTTFSVPEGGTTLWLQVHGLNYQSMASIRLNGGRWISLNNTNCVFDGPAARFRGMGGPLATISFSIPSAPLRPDAANTLSFRFNMSEGQSMGFRVLAINVLDAQGRRLLAETRPVLAARRTAPTAADVLAGSNLWYNASLREGWAGPPLVAKCSDCHAEDGTDLKYYGFSDRSITERSRFHGLTVRQGQQIASFIRSLPSATYGTAWDPPYQPGPGTDSKDKHAWAAGAGLRWVVPDDSLTWDYVFTNDQVAFNATNTLNVREIPVALQLPDWNDWLPHIHPLDFYGESIRPVMNSYERLKTAVAPGDLRYKFMEWDQALSNWLNGPASELPAEVRNHPRAWEAYWSLSRWRTVKAWERMRASGFEVDGKRSDAGVDADRFWGNQQVFLSAPHFTVQPENGHFLRDGSALVWGIKSQQWYYLQLVLSGAMHSRGGSAPIDWAYMTAFTSGLNQHGMQNAAQMSIVNIKSLEATTDRPLHGNDGFLGFGGPRIEYIWNRERRDMWSGYAPEFRDAFVREWLRNYAEMVYKVGRDHFIYTTREMDEGETDNTPGAPHARPWIRSHAGMLVFMKDRGAAPDIVQTMVELGQYLWPDADWTRF